MKTKTSRTRNSLIRSPLRHGLFLTALMLACFALSPLARATCQDGCDTSNGNTFLGDNALISNTTGSDNAAIGSNALHRNTTGGFNTANGAFALFSNTIGFVNVANGYQALSNNTTGFQNTATGASALFANTTGFNNTATGTFALFTNTTGSNNTATGKDTLAGNTTGFQNTAIGETALLNNNSGSNNTAGGFAALFRNTRGNSNTATGVGALQNNVTSSNNTADGFNALFNNKGNSNTAVGVSAGFNLTTGDNNIDIGNVGVAAESNTIRMGNETHTNTFVAGISGVTIPDGVGVIIDTSGHLGTVVSSERFKDNVQPMDKASEAILALKPVTFRYKHELDPDGIPQFGLVAEDVEKVNPDLVARDADGKAYTVRYEAVNAMLLNEFLKEHGKVQALEAAIAQQERDFESAISQLQSALKEQAAQIKKVSTQVQANKPTPCLVSKNEQEQQPN